MTNKKKVTGGKRPQNLRRTLGQFSAYLGRHRIMIGLVTLLAAIKLVLAVLALIGLAQMWMAVVVDAVLTVLTVFNTSRLLGSKPEISEE